MTEYGKKLVHNIATGQVEYVELTEEEIADRDAVRAAGLVELAAEEAQEQRVETAITFLEGQDYKIAFDAVKASNNLSVEEKQLFSRLIKGQAAVVQILRQVGQDIDLSGW